MTPVDVSKLHQAVQFLRFLWRLCCCFFSARTGEFQVSWQTKNVCFFGKYTNLQLVHQKIGRVSKRLCSLRFLFAERATTEGATSNQNTILAKQDFAKPGRPTKTAWSLVEESLLRYCSHLDSFGAKVAMIER